MATDLGLYCLSVPRMRLLSVKAIDSDPFYIARCLLCNATILSVELSQKDCVDKVIMMSNARLSGIWVLQGVNFRNAAYFTIKAYHRGNGTRCKTCATCEKRTRYKPVQNYTGFFLLYPVHVSRA